jgi:hypothetical protein
LALIELSPDQPVVAPASLPPAYRYRALGLTLATLLVLALAGASPAQIYRWRHAGLVSLPVEADFQVAGGRLFTFEVAGGRRVTSAWAVRPLRRLWRVVSTTDDTSGGLLQGGASVSIAGRFVLVQAGPISTVLDGRTGAVRWQSPLPVVPISETTGMVEEDHFRTGTEYDEQSGAPGALFFGSDGRPHTEPPLSAGLTGVDLATGRPIWTASFAGSISPAKTRDRDGTVIVAAADRLSLRSVRDGKVLASTPLPPVADGGSSWAQLIGDVVLVGQGKAVTAYRTADLTRRWQITEPDDAGNYASCTGLICGKAGPALVALDPATGRPRWRTDGQVDVVTGADYDILVQTGESRPVRAVEPASGDLAADLSGWQTFTTTTGAGPVLLTRAGPVRGTTFGVLRPGGRMVEQLGTTQARVTNCSVDTRFVACRTPTGIEVFTYAA